MKMTWLDVVRTVFPDADDDGDLRTEGRDFIQRLYDAEQAAQEREQRWVEADAAKRAALRAAKAKAKP